MRDRSSNVTAIEDARRKRAQQQAAHARTRDVVPEAPLAAPCVDDAAPYAAPQDVADVLAQLVDTDGTPFVGITVPPLDCVGWMLTPEQGERLGELLIREAQRVRDKDKPSDL